MHHHVATWSGHERFLLTVRDKIADGYE